MAIKKIFEKLMGKGKPIKGKIPDEVELESYLEEERRKNIKKLVGKFREQKNREMFQENTLVSGRKSIVEADNVINKSQRRIGKVKPILGHSRSKKNKLKGRMFF